MKISKMKWFKRKKKPFSLSDWIGKRCCVKFDLPPGKHSPIGDGGSGHAVLLAIEMPLICMENIHGGIPVWVSANIIKEIKLFGDG